MHEAPMAPQTIRPQRRNRTRNRWWKSRSTRTNNRRQAGRMWTVRIPRDWDRTAHGGYAKRDCIADLQLRQSIPWPPRPASPTADRSSGSSCRTRAAC